MKNEPSIKKIPLDSLIDLLIQLYESGVDFVDLAADNTDPKQDKLVIITMEGYINPEYYDEKGLADFEIFDEQPKRKKKPNSPPRKLSDDDINLLL